MEAPKHISSASNTPQNQDASIQPLKEMSAAGLINDAHIKQQMLRLMQTNEGLRTILGTLPYMAPEQHFGAPPDPTSDQFSYCVALYEALHGQHPFVVDGEWSDPDSPLDLLSNAVLLGARTWTERELHRLVGAWARRRRSMSRKGSTPIAALRACSCRPSSFPLPSRTGCRRCSSTWIRKYLPSIAMGWPAATRQCASD